MSHSKDAPTLPTIIDEAGDSPGWVPALGVGLLIVIVMAVAIRAFVGEDATTPKAEEAPAAEAAPGAEEAPAMAPTPSAAPAAL